MDTFDDATHRSLDEQVTEHCQRFPTNLDPFSQLVLLSAIVEFSEDTLDHQYQLTSNAVSLLERDPDLPALLDTAWKDKSYRTIRELSILQVARPASSSQGTAHTEEQDDLYKSFKVPYRGAAVRSFCQYLAQNHGAFALVGQAKHYGRFCSIVQSSGTGKSRLMFELSKEGVVVLYVNLRPLSDNSGFPPRDHIPADILTHDLPSDPVAYAARCCAFFAAVFTTLTKYLRDDIQLDLKAAKERWTATMCDVRSKERGKFFAALKDSYEESIKKIGSRIPSEDAAQKTTEQMNHLSQVVTAGINALTMPGEGYMTTAFQDMVIALKPLFREKGDNAPKLVVALDEAHHLSVMTNYRPSTLVCRAISLFSGPWRIESPPFWVVFASTTSNVAHFAAPRAYSDSARVPRDGQLLFPPYSQLGWDQNADPLDAIAATDVAKAHHIIGYGRSLWTSVKDMHRGVDSMLTFASSKLSGPPGEPNKALVALGQRFCLNVAFGHREAASFIESSVTNHLRVCITTTDDRNWTYTTYPSEPLLSCAAASLMHKTSAQFSEYLEVLQAKVLNGMIDLGKSGELASRLLWLLAKDLLVRTTLPLQKMTQSAPLLGSEWDSEFIDCKMISVHDYFEFLFGQNFWSVAGSDAKKAFDNAHVNFSHWVSMDETIWKKDRSDQLSPGEWTLRHWHRTSAVQCCHHQPLIDKMIPIYFKADKQRESSGASLDHSSDLARVSQIFISDKASKDQNHHDPDKITRNHESIQCHSSLPWVAILADLGLPEGTLELTAEYLEVNSDELADSDGPELDGPCLRIYAPEISVKTSPFLKEHTPLHHTLREIIHREKISSTSRKIIGDLQAQVQYGSTPTKRHMKWEAQ